MKTIHAAWSSILLSTVLFSTPAEAGNHVLQFTATGANLTSTRFILDNPNLNGKPTAKLIVTQRFTTTANTNPIGVVFDASLGSKGMWAIVNEDGAVIPDGAEFNVLVGTLTTVNASILNSLVNLTFFTTAAGKPPFYSLTPPTKVKPGFLFFTHNVIPVQKLKFGVFVRHNQSLDYGLVPGQPTKWVISNEDSSQALAASYFILDASTPPKGAAVFGHTSDSTGATGNISGNQTLINNDATNNKPSAVLFVAPLQDQRNDKSISVFYNTASSKWTISSGDQSTFPSGLSFNVLVFPGAIQ